MPRFFGSFVFNRKRNVVELELKEDLTGRGSMKYSRRYITYQQHNSLNLFTESYSVPEIITMFVIWHFYSFRDL